MSEFKAIETQEELDKIIKDRLSRNTKTVTDEVTKKYEGFISPDDAAKQKKTLEDKITELNTKLKEKDTSIADLTAKNAAYETASVKAKIAREYGIPAELADRLSGNNEEEFKKDAENLVKFVQKEQPAPLYNGEHSSSASSTDAALLSVLEALDK